MGRRGGALRAGAAARDVRRCPERRVAARCRAGSPPRTRSRETAALVRRLVVPRLLREARDRGWWDPRRDARASVGGSSPASPRAASAGSSARPGRALSSPSSCPTSTRRPGRASSLAPRVVAPGGSGGRSRPDPGGDPRRRGGVGRGRRTTWSWVWPSPRRGRPDGPARPARARRRARGSAGRPRHATAGGQPGGSGRDHPCRAGPGRAARRRPSRPDRPALLARAGFTVGRAGGAVGSADPSAVVGIRGPESA